LADADQVPAVVSPFSGREGFVDDGTGVAAHYGTPVAEQRALAGGTAIVDLSSRGVLTVSGPDRLTWLHSLTSQSLTGLAPGDSTETLLLDANGRLEHAARVVDDGETTWLLVDLPEAEPLRAWLDRMRFMLRVEVADRTADVATIGSLGDVALPVPVLAPAGVPVVWVDPWSEVAVGGHSYADAEAHPGREWTARETLVARSDLDALAAALPRVASVLGEAEVEDAVARVVAARRLVVVASGLSSPLALDLSMRLTAVGRPAEFVADPVGQQIAVSRLSPEDVVVVISGSGANELSLRGARSARAAGAAVVAVTSFATSPLGALADVALVVAPAKAGFRHEVERTSRIPHVIVLESLVEIVADRLGATAADARAGVLTILSENLSD